MIRSQSTASSLFVACALTGFSAFAQQAAGTAAVGVQGSATAGTQAAPAAPVDPNAAAAAPANQQAQMGMALPTATAAAPAAGTSDHDAVVGHLAVGYLGRATIPYGPYNGAATLEAPAPVIGVRYWFDPMVGLDLGLGLWLGGVSTDTTATPPGTTVSSSGPKPAAFVIHAGVPLALATAKHFTFEIIPEANFGYAQVSQDAILGGGPGVTNKLASTWIWALGQVLKFTSDLWGCRNCHCWAQSACVSTTTSSGKTRLPSLQVVRPRISATAYGAFRRP